MGVRGGLEAAVHSFSTVIDSQESDPNLCCLKIDFSNAFNECLFLIEFRGTSLRSSPGLSGVITAKGDYIYALASAVSIISSSGVRQRDILGPLLLSEIILNLLDYLTPIPDLYLQTWYLDGAFVDPRVSVAARLDQLSSIGP